MVLQAVGSGQEREALLKRLRREGYAMGAEFGV
jgi:hypothetical protein